MELDLSDRIRELYLDQANYADGLFATSELFERQGFYKKIADLIFNNVNRESSGFGTTMIDVGCGDCKLIRYVHELKKDMTIIGIDVNPLILIMGNGMLTKLGYDTNFHYGIRIAKEPDTHKYSLISDTIIGNKSYKFKKGGINLLQEDFRFGEVLRDNCSDIDIITYILPGGFSPHITFEKGKKKYNSVEAALEMNKNVLAIGLELLKIGGRMIWGIRATSSSLEKLRNTNLDDLDLSLFKEFYDIKRVEIINIDQNGYGLGSSLSLPAFTFDKKTNTVHYTNDIRNKTEHDIVVVLMEMIKKANI